MPRYVEAVTLQTCALHVTVVLVQQCGVRMFKIVEVGKEGVAAHGQRVVNAVGDERVDAEDGLSGKILGSFFSFIVFCIFAL